VNVNATWLALSCELDAPRVTQSYPRTQNVNDNFTFPVRTLDRSLQAPACGLWS
jgi:hypothetical protein